MKFQFDPRKSLKVQFMEAFSDDTQQVVAVSIQSDTGSGFHTAYLAVRMPGTISPTFAMVVTFNETVNSVYIHRIFNEFSIPLEPALCSAPSSLLDRLSTVDCITNAEFRKNAVEWRHRCMSVAKTTANVKRSIAA